MSTRRRGLAGLFGRESHSPAVPSPPTTPRPVRVPDPPKSEPRIMTSDELQQNVESLENVLGTMDQVRDQMNRYNATLREHARSLRRYAADIQMVSSRDDRGTRTNVGDDFVSESLLVHCSHYYDRLAEAQEYLARQYLVEYNILNNYAAKHFKTLARDSAKLDTTLKDLTIKLSKIANKSAPPGSPNTLNASTVQNAGPHELYVQRLTALSSQIQRVRNDHLADYTRIQKDVDRTVARSFARCSRQNYDALGAALIKTGGTEAIGGVTAWGVYANQRISPPMNHFDDEGDGEIDPNDEWEPDDDETEDHMSQRQIAREEIHRPPTSFSEFSKSPDPAYNPFNPHTQMSINMQGKLPARVSQTAFEAYPGSSQIPQSSQSQQYQITQVTSPVPAGSGHRLTPVGQPSSNPQLQQYAPVPPGPSTVTAGGGTQANPSHFREQFSPVP